MRSTMLHRRDDKPYLLVRTAIQSLATNTRGIDKNQSRNSSLCFKSFILFMKKRSFYTRFKICSVYFREYFFIFIKYKMTVRCMICMNVILDVNSFT